MKPEDFAALPPGIALRVLLECLPEETRDAVLAKPALRSPLPPKYDQAIFRSEGVQWASELDLPSLRYWRQKSLEGGDPKYADSNRKRAESLARWIAWRDWYPEAIWTGERDRQRVTAAPPSREPQTYPRAGGNGARRPPAPTQPADEIDPDADIPF